MNDRSKLSRRAVLRGIGAAICLPFLDVFGAAADRASGPASRKTRLAYLYFPNGAAEGTWSPRRTGNRGELLELSEWMKPLEPFKRDIIIPGNMWTPRGNGHGAGTATWLTGGSYDSKAIDAGGISVDQLAAKHVGQETLLPSLELSLRGEGFFSGNLPRNTISWTSDTTPASREVEPRVVFDRMFRRAGGGVDRSVLDLVLGQARSLRPKLGPADRRKVDEYLDSVRSVERRIGFAEQQSRRVRADGGLNDSLTRPPPGIPTNHEEYVRLMLDLMALALWSGATRISTFMLDHGQSNRYLNFVDGVKGTWHALSHYKDISGKTEDDDGKTSWKSVGSKKEMYSAVNRWHHRQVAYLLGRMKEMDDGDGSLLDNSVIVYGSSLADGHEHEADNLPLLVAGRGGGTIKPGRFVRYEKKTTLSNLHLSMLVRLGIRLERFGDSTGLMTELEG
ncbi:MAG: DUF1552 domain-containing protein [Planctomycetota bacterium]|nr:DUF1552 domain-containing protein [Planctomycetota bacterium]